MPEQTSQQLEDQLDPRSVKLLTEIALAEYSYWRDVDDPLIQSFAMGAMGAAANILQSVAVGNSSETHRRRVTERSAQPNYASIKEPQEVLAALEAILSITGMGSSLQRSSGYERINQFALRVQRWFAHNFLHLQPAILFQLLCRIAAMWNRSSMPGAAPEDPAELKKLRYEVEQSIADLTRCLPYHTIMRIFPTKAEAEQFSKNLRPGNFSPPGWDFSTEREAFASENIEHVLSLDGRGLMRLPPPEAQDNRSHSYCGQCGREITGQDHRGNCPGVALNKLRSIIPFIEEELKVREPSGVKLYIAAARNALLHARELEVQLRCMTVEGSVKC